MKVEINVPDSLNEITLSQYQRFEKLNTKENQGSTFLLQKMVEIFCNLDLKDVAEIKYKSVQGIALHLNKVFDKKHSLIPTFNLRGVEYGFIPVLDDMSLGEYVDRDENLGDWETMHKAMAVLYRPVNFRSKERYTIAPYEPSDEVSELMREMPLDVVMSSMVFFYDLGKELLGAIPKYLEQKLKKQDMQTLDKHLQKNGVGINQFMHSLKVMSETSMQLPNFHSTSV